MDEDKTNVDIVDIKYSVSILFNEGYITEKQWKNIWKKILLKEQRRVIKHGMD